MVFHGGAVQGYRGLMAFLPDQDVGIVVLWNSESAAALGPAAELRSTACLACRRATGSGSSDVDPAEAAQD